MQDNSPFERNIYLSRASRLACVSRQAGACMHPTHLWASGLWYSTYHHNPEALLTLGIVSGKMLLSPWTWKQQSLSAVGFKNCFLYNTRNVHPVSLGSIKESCWSIFMQRLKNIFIFSLLFFLWVLEYRSQVSVEVSITTTCIMLTPQSKSITFRLVAS